MAENNKRFLGDMNFPYAFKVSASKPLDCRTVVNALSDLIDINTWPDAAGTPTLYNGLVVAVLDDGTSEPALYMLTDVVNWSSITSWRRLDATAATVIDVITNIDDEQYTEAALKAAALSAYKGKAILSSLDDISDSVDSLVSNLNGTNTSIGKIERVLGSTDDTALTVEQRITNAVTQAKTDITNSLSNVYRYKGTVTNFADLPKTDLTGGDVYNVVNANNDIPAGTNYAWNATTNEWDPLGGSVDLSGYAEQTDVDNLSNTLTTVSGNLSTLTGKVTGIETTVGSHTSTLNTLTGSGEGSITKKLEALESSIDTKLDAKVDAVEGSRLITTAEATAITTNSSNISHLGTEIQRVSSSVQDVSSRIEVIEYLYLDSSIARIDNSIGQINENIDSIQDDVNTLMADKTSEGSVDYKIANALKWIDYVAPAT